LGLLASLAPQQPELLVRFHPLGGDRETEHVPELDYGLNDGGGAGITRDVAHE
jgi:hypothetical protein